MTEDNETKETAQGLESYMEGIDEQLQWALERCQYPMDDGKAITEKNIKGEMEVACDGTLKLLLGTLAGLSKGMDEGRGYKFWNRVPGTDEDQHSYRSKLCGILGHVLFLTRLVAYHKITDGTVTVGCDNESALWSALGKEEVTTVQPSFDILQVIKYHVQQSPIKWVRRHIKGH